MGLKANPILTSVVLNGPSCIQFSCCGGLYVLIAACQTWRLDLQSISVRKQIITMQTSLRTFSLALQTIHFIGTLSKKRFSEGESYVLRCIEDMQYDTESWLQKSIDSLDLCQLSLSSISLVHSAIQMQHREQLWRVLYARTVSAESCYFYAKYDYNSKKGSRSEVTWCRCWEPSQLQVRLLG